MAMEMSGEEGFWAEVYKTVEESPVPTYAEVSGTIPKWITGTFLRVGPGKFEWGDTKYNHLFDGDAILHRFEIKEGTVKFSSRFLRSDSFTESEKKGRIAYTQFGTVAPPDPCKNIFARFMSYFSLGEMTDNCNVNIVEIKGNKFASTETTKMWQIDPDTLESLTQVDASTKLSGPRSWLAHPHYDDDGNYYNFSTAYTRKVHQLIKIPTEKAQDEDLYEGMEIILSLPYQKSPAYYHSFAMTDNYFIFIESSLMLSHPAKFLFMKIMNWTFADMFYFDKNVKSKLHLIERQSCKVVGVFSTEAFMCFHQVNAYEKENAIIFDMCGYNDEKILQKAYLKNLKNDQSDEFKTAIAELRRYCLPLEKANADNPVHMELPKDDCGKDYKSIYMDFELPRINYEMFNGKEYNFAYGISSATSSTQTTSIVKVDLNTKESWTWEEQDCVASEPVFIPHPNAEIEDDGIVISSVIGIHGKKSFLLLLDAKTMKEVARAHVTDRLLMLIHGQFFNQTN